MANLPSLRTKNTVSDGYVDALVDQMAKGVHPRDIARRLHPGSTTGSAGRETRRLQRKTYRELRRLALYDPRVAQGIVDESRLQMMADLAPTVKALGERAKRGRPDAGKLVLEATGFHNPRVKHEHSGEIKVKLEMPRPTFEQDVSDQVTDAEVVD